MSFKSQYKSSDLNFTEEYKKALFGTVFVAYEDIYGNIFLPEEDKKAINVAKEVYQRMLSMDISLYIQEEEKEIPISDKEAFLRISGLPIEVIENEDKVSYKVGLSSLKKETYIQIAKKENLDENTKWFRNDFTCYCLKNGFFFPYDETQPFLNSQNKHLRVFILEKNLSEKYQHLYKEATTDRFAIDFLLSDCDLEMIDFMKKFDSFSFDRRLSYFVNELNDDEINGVIQNFGQIKGNTFDTKKLIERYTFILKQYFISLINALYDDYCLEVLKQITVKLSYLTISKIYLDRDIYSLSSYTADIFSFDGINFFFSHNDKDMIQMMIEKEIKEKPKESVLELYSHLKLPYYVYKYIKDIKQISTDNIINALPFDEISEQEAFLSVKRYDDYYSYLSLQEEHRCAFNLRLLNKHNIKYSYKKPAFTKDRFEKLTLKLGNDSFSSIFKTPTPFSKDVFPSYTDTIFQTSSLINTINELDIKSKNEAFIYFYSSFVDKSLFEVVSTMFGIYEINVQLDDIILNFFNYALKYPLLLVEQEYREEKIESHDSSFLYIFDKTKDEEERYELSLKYPYSTHGKLVFSFKNSIISKTPYICRCQEKAIKSKIEYLSKQTNHHMTSNEILDNLGLPRDITNSLNPNKDIIQQLHFKSNLCHICNHTTPIYSENSPIDLNDTSINAYLPYIRAKASENGLYFDEPMNLAFDYSAFYKSLENNTYTGLLHFDRTKIHPCLLPYINVSKMMLASLFSSFFPDDALYKEFYIEFNSFLSLPETKIIQLLFDCKTEDYHYIYKYENLILRIAYIYKMVELSYAIFVSKDIIGSEHQFSLNIDYNHNLKHPYVILGKYVNAYADSPYDNNFYLSNNDKDSLMQFAKRYLSLYENNHLNPDIKTPMILGILGFPYLVTLKYSSLKLNSDNVEEIFNQMNFKSGIDRKDLNISHAAYIEPFRKAFPFKQNEQAEFVFARNAIFNDGIKIISDLDIDDIVYDKNHIYELDGKFDEYICIYSYCGNEMPISLFKFFNMDFNTLKGMLDDFINLDKDDLEIKATMSGVILDTYFENKSLFLDFIEDCTNDTTLREKVLNNFPQITRVREEIKEKVMQEILSFITYLMQLFIEGYVEKEKRIGR